MNIYSCHLGKSIIYDTVSNASWTVDVRTHGIVNVIDRILSDSWPPSVEIGREVPQADAEIDCVVSRLCALLVYILIFFFLLLFKRNVTVGILEIILHDFSLLFSILLKYYSLILRILIICTQILPLNHS